MVSGARWAPENHALFPAPFKAAARTLLLINACRGFGAGGGQRQGRRRASARASKRRATAGVEGEGAGAGRGVELPQDVLALIFELAAHPLPAWVPQLSMAGPAGAASA